MSGTGKETLACTFFELRVREAGTSAASSNMNWHSWLISKRCRKLLRFNRTYADTDDGPCWHSAPGLALSLKASMTRGLNDPPMVSCQILKRNGADPT